ncbi:hypothetical protein ACOSQ3_018471 [Xanthoceras sorbifolium]
MSWFYFISFFASAMGLPFLLFVDGTCSKTSLFEEEREALDAIKALIPSDPRERTEYRRVTEELLVSFKLAPNSGGAEAAKPRVPSREVVSAEQVQGTVITYSRSQTQMGIEQQ